MWVGGPTEHLAVDSGLLKTRHHVKIAACRTEQHQHMQKQEMRRKNPKGMRVWPLPRPSSTFPRWYKLFLLLLSV